MFICYKVTITLSITHYPLPTTIFVSYMDDGYNRIDAGKLASGATQ